MRQTLQRIAVCLLVASPAASQGMSVGIVFGPTLPSYCSLGEPFFLTADSKLYFCTSKEAATWTVIGGSGGALPTGAVIAITSGTCPAGTTEAADLSGKFLLGTVAANSDVGTAGGADAITPQGTVSQPTLTMNSYTPAGTNSWPAGVPTFTGIAATTVVNHLHTLATGTGSTGNFSQVIGTVDTSSGGTGATPTQTALGTLSGNPTVGGAASYTPKGTVAWPAGVPSLTGTAATLTGTVSQPTFTGTQFDNRPAFTKVIFCRAN